METDFREMVIGSYSSQVPLITVEALERTEGHPQDLILIHEATHKFFIELTGSGNLMRALMSTHAGEPISHPFLEKYFCETRAIHECLALTVEAIYANRNHKSKNIDTYISEQYKEYYGLLSEFHNYLLSNAHSERLVLQFGLLVLGELFDQQTILTAQNLADNEDYCPKSTVTLKTRFDDACVALDIGINKYSNDIDMVMQEMVVHFPHEWTAINHHSVNSLLRQLPPGRIKKFFGFISNNYNKDDLDIETTFNNVVIHSARQTAVHFRGRFGGKEIKINDIDAVLDAMSGFYVHFYPNMYSFPLKFMMDIQPQTCMILIDILDRSLSSKDHQNPFKAQSVARFVIHVPNSSVPELLLKFLEQKKNVVIIDPSFFDAKANSVFGVAIPKGRKVILFDPVGTIGSVELFLLKLYESSYPTAFNKINLGDSETAFACVKPLNDSWVFLSPYFVNEKISNMVGGIETYFPKSCRVCSSNEEFGMPWELEEPIVFCLRHNEDHGW